MAMTKTDSIDPGDLFTIFKLDESDYRAATLAAVIAWLQDSLVFPGGVTTQYSAPSATGFTVTVSDIGSDVHLILTPVAGYAAGTITLPSATASVDGQLLIVNSTQSVTTLAIGLNGAAGAVGAPTTLAANGFFTLKFDKLSGNWYRIG